LTKLSKRCGQLPLFTTHTPVPAGHDVFSSQLIEKYFHNYWGSLGIGREKFLGLGGRMAMEARPLI